MFKLSRSRDAWATIRGFTYQAALTIERWLDLDAGQTLELERGEDIDLVARILDAEDPEETGRLLEQVKHLEQNVTLRSPAALSAIANACEHLENNQDLAVEFQFTTTAGVGTEQGDALQRACGIELWEKLRLGKVPPAEEAAKVEMIRSQLRLATRPADLPKATWRLLQKRLKKTKASTAELMALIRRFRWVTGQPDLAEDWQALQRRLVVLGYAADMEEARSRCEQLFAFVYRRLSSKGLKTLDTADLQAALRDPALGALWQQNLRRLEDVQRIFERRLGQTERVVVKIQQELARYAEQQEVLTEVVYTRQAVALDVPPVATELAARTDAVALLDRAWQGAAWLALHGSVSTGKTHLAVLLCQERGCRAWISFDGSSGAESSAKLNASLEAMAGEPVPAMLGPWLDAQFEKLGAGAVLVLSDLPRLIDNQALADRLALLVGSAAKHGVLLLSTSTEPLPASFLRRLAPGVIVPVPTPDFSVADTEELLRAKGAPGDVIRRAKPLCELGRCNAALVSALVEHLRRRGWNYDRAWFDSVLEGEHSAELDGETLVRLTTGISDDNNRELLYRLGLVTGRFGEEEVRALCEAVPPLNHPAQRVRALHGPWLQGESGGPLQASPLLAKLSAANLAEGTRLDCCRRLSRVITSRPSINQTQLLAALNYASRGEEPERAAALLARGLSALIQYEAYRADDVMLNIWTDTPMPAEIPVGVRVHLRSLQIFVRHRAKLPIADLVQDMCALLPQLPAGETWPLVGAAVLTVPVLVSAGIAAGFALLHDVLVQRDGLRLPDGSSVEAAEGFALENLLWLPMEHPLTEESLREWTKTFAGLPADVRARALAGKIGAMGAQAMAIRPIVQEQARPEGEQRWEAVAELLAELGREAKAVDAELLWANLVRARLIVLGEHLGRAEDARTEAQGALDQGPGDPTVRFLLQEQIGTLLLGDPEHRSVGLDWLRRALGEDSPYHADLRASGWLQLSWALGEGDPRDAVPAAKRAVEVLRSDAERTALEIGRALGEHAVALWLAGDVAEAANIVGEAAKLLFSVREDTETWKGLIFPMEILVAHLLVQAQTGRQLPVLADGSSPPAVLRRMFCGLIANSASLYQPKFEAMLHFQSARLADLNGLSVLADEWRARGLGLTDLEGGSEQIAKLTIDDLSAKVTQGDLAGALEDAVEAAVIMEMNADGGTGADGHVDPATILGAKPNDRWKKAEAFAAQHFLYATGFYLLRLAQDNRTEARRRAAEAARLCREQAPTMTEPECWVKAAELFELMSAEESEPTELAGFTPQALGSNWLALFELASFAASTAPNVTMADAFEWQVRAMRAAELYFNVCSVPAIRSALPFLREYWLRRFAQSPMGFRHREDVERALKATEHLPSRQQAKHVFRTILEGLGLDFPDEQIRQWCLEHA